MSPSILGIASDHLNKGKRRSNQTHIKRFLEKSIFEPRAYNISVKADIVPHVPDPKISMQFVHRNIKYAIYK